MDKLKSRKFWMAIGAIIVTITAGIGYDLDPKLVVLLTSAESALWIVAETILDAIHITKGR